MEMTIQLNGEPYTTQAGLRVEQLLQVLDLRPNRVAVEINQNVVAKRDYAQTMINPGDRVEVINFVGGG